MSIANNTTGLQSPPSGDGSAILQAIKANQPAPVALVEIPAFTPFFDDVVAKYMEVLTAIGGDVYLVNSNEEIIEKIKLQFPGAGRIVSFCAEFAGIAEEKTPGSSAHSYENVDVFIMKPALAVAENSAVWITDNDVPVRVLPFIAQSVVAIIRRQDIVATMHHAYDKIADVDYGFATFIAGPSKTADIEQSLVLGAHGPKTMTVFIQQ
ncbi:LutC/YkgG family protein [Foetidibacter luteolus]|uniref:LutC/YkgG family protein n=1 Tax=Foetidibacter luteolus TaxID=2608880 RepID=UPI00129B361B|nr:LUD domain-containing protein [Foetidibacter luteolus]